MLHSGDGELDRRIDFVERKVLLVQDRIVKSREKANATTKRLTKQLRAHEDMKKEWIRKINLERERMKTERNESFKIHRHHIDDLRIKYEEERENKLRELRTLIKEEEREIKELQRQRDEAVMKTRAEEMKIKSRYQLKINELLKEEQATARIGVVKQKRLLETPNIFSMSIEKSNPIGMKKRSQAVRRPT